jgi:hypothetical protein
MFTTKEHHGHDERDGGKHPKGSTRGHMVVLLLCFTRLCSLYRGITGSSIWDG